MNRTHLFSRGRRLLLAAALAAAAAPAAFAQTDWPAKPVHVIVNFPPGGPLDLIARSVADELGKQFKQPFIVENKAGAGGNIGADYVAKSAPDGYTVLFGIDSTFTVNPHIYPHMGFKPQELKPVMIAASSGLLIGVNPATGFKTLNDLVAAAKVKPVTFSSAGNGSPGHLAAEVLTDATGAKITHVPYKGNAPAVTAVLSGQVNGGALATPGMLPHVKAGKITALAVTSHRRSKLAPNIPTVAEAGLPQLEQEVLYLMMVPAATPDAIVQKLAKATEHALAQPQVRERLDHLDLHEEGTTGAAAAKRLQDAYDRYGKVIRATGMKVE